LEIAVVIPSFRRGSGGHATIVALLRALQSRGHSVSLWLEDCEGRHSGEPGAVTRRSFEQFFAAGELRLEPDLGAWSGADIALATGWQTVARTLLLGDVAARAYLVQDHEPDFYGASAAALWAEQSYQQGLHCIAASRWLAERLRARYGATASHFELAFDEAVYQPGADSRQQDLVVFYARAVTPRRAAPLGLLALLELTRRRPSIEIALFGEDRRIEASFPHRQLGVLEPAQLADLYRQAAVGMVLSMTNPSLVSLEMMACGLPCVELASDSMLATFTNSGPLTLAEPDPLALCEAVERLLDDGGRRESCTRGGLELMAERSWGRAAEQVEQGLRAALGP
jgi:glycosyltransferase involved in cell wall biosynthesis